MDAAQSDALIKDLLHRVNDLRGYLDYEEKKNRLEIVSAALEAPDIWNDPENAQALGKEKKALDAVVVGIEQIEQGLGDTAELFQMAQSEQDIDTFAAVEQDAAGLLALVEGLEFRRMFANPADPSDCFVEIQSGAGGTEAQDWAQMLQRQYLRYCERKGFKAELLEETEGDTAGIKGCTIKVAGEYAYGYLRSETGIHRLVRKSPFDSNNGRHTSFASVYVYPEVDESIQIDINPADLRIDVFRASGAGGQHVNKTESAVRITHMPTNIVVQCQNDRSQHRNRDEAMNMLRARLFELEMRKRRAEQDKVEASKTDIGWGHQIRSYVLDQSRIKDLRTNYETSNTKVVLDGDLDAFIQASLKMGV
ncbi:MAG: peptide chain release factor 2 [Betaproteobacteria bacterium]|nr:peptide chain release factor 2 [Betaproteobacteria bacterium]